MALDTTVSGSSADSYGSVTEADTYFSSRGITEWTGTTTAKENAMRRATSYLDNRFRNVWRGVRYLQTQVLAWPRLDGGRNNVGHSVLVPLYDRDGFEISYATIPLEIKNAQFEVALLILTGVDLQPTLDRGGMIKSISKGVGPLQKAIVYADGASPVDRYMKIEGYLGTLVTTMPGASGGTIQMVRG